MSDHVLGLLKVLAVSVTCCLAPSPAAWAAPADADPPGEETNEPIKITVWLVSNEPWTNHKDGNPRELLEEFNKGLDDTGVTVLNVEDLVPLVNLPQERNNVLYRLDEVREQKGALACFKQFVQKHGRDKVAIDVRFVGWGEAFELLDEGLPKQMTLSSTTPDIVQIGSTWRGRYAPYAHDDSRQKLPGYSALQQNAPTLPYILDVRLLLYWKLSVGGDPGSLEPQEKGPSVRDFANWEEVIERLHKLNASLGAGGQSPTDEAPMPLVFQTEPGSQNLMHDYVPLVWSGGGEFIDGDGRVDLSSDAALEVPRLLRRSVWQSAQGAQPYKLIKFSPESQAVIQETLFNGEYGAATLPANALPSFYRNLSRNPGQISDPWDHLGIALLPCTFRGGSDLLVTKGAGVGRKKELAFDLARELAPESQESDYAQVLAGHGLCIGSA